MESKSNKYYFRLLLICTVFLSLVPFFKVGLTNGDDIEYYLTYLSDKHEFNNPDIEEKPDVFNENTFHKYHKNASTYAKSAGRFYFLITKPLYSLPYIFDNFYFTKCVQYFFLLLSFVIFAFLVFKIFKSKWLSLLTFLFFIIPLSIIPFNIYIPTTFYPFFFTFSFSLTMISLILLLKYYETNKYKFIIFSVLVYAVAILFYETYLLFLGFIILFILIRAIWKSGFANTLKNRQFYKEILPYITLAILYVIIYFTYRQFVKTDEGFYVGSSFAEDFSIQHFFRILIEYNNAVLPTMIYHISQEVISANSLLPRGHYDNFFYILTHSSASWIVNAMIQVALYIFILLKTNPNRKWRTIGIGALIALAFTIFSHTLIAISDKYNRLYYFFDGYVTSYYSVFGITLFLVLAFYAGYKLCFNNKYLKIGFLIISSGLIFYTSIITSYTNDHLSRDWERSQNRFMMTRDLSRQGAFNVIPDNALIYAGDLDQSSAIYGENVTWQGLPWQYFIYCQGGKNLHIRKTLEELERDFNKQEERPLYLIQKKENRLNNNMFMIISEIDRSTMKWGDEDPFRSAICVGKTQLHYYSPMKSYNLIYAKQNLCDSVSCDPSYNTLHISSLDKHRKIISTTVDFDQVFAKSIAISNYNAFATRDTIFLE
ncbi:hypothetical protein LJC68_03060 [Bacteroidales bacterium OttesenSCG-928-B11]|nr:hypothetical protein [Bacteroidales bacterium OttesenSCG-928-C03]MDL2311840.1 hypothetical protein [Bacteroidales bacterium OttesenSCG-928-B11]MDL2325510.1 hypothetical protein [Bacteroidales bacterium OttesenSCG-928-A14]